MPILDRLSNYFAKHWILATGDFEDAVKCAPLDTSSESLWASVFKGCILTSKP